VATALRKADAMRIEIDAADLSIASAFVGAIEDAFERAGERLPDFVVLAFGPQGPMRPYAGAERDGYMALVSLDHARPAGWMRTAADHLAVAMASRAGEPTP
jgi:hypothetical protein